TTASTTATSRAPRRSASWPSGRPALRPTTPATDRPSPTCVAVRPADLVRNTMLVVTHSPVPQASTRVHTAKIPVGPVHVDRNLVIPTRTSIGPATPTAVPRRY